MNIVVKKILDYIFVFLLTITFAKNLEASSEGIRVKIIEKDKSRAELIANELNNTIVINGDGLDEDVLKEANVEEAETVLSLTNDD